MTLEQEKCENCGRDGLNSYIEKPNHTLLHCPECDLFQKGSLESPLVYEDFYHQCYENRRDQKIVTSSIRIGAASAYVTADKPRSLDIGCSVGATVEAAKRLGWDASGVDISSQAVKFCRERGLDCHKIDGLELPFEDETFDFVSNTHVIEHVEDINATLAEWFRVLKPGGVMMIETPNADYLKARIMGPRYKKFWPPEHLYTFNRKNLGTLLERTGFEVLSTRLIGGMTTLPPHITAYALAYRGFREVCRSVRMCKSFEICCRRPARMGAMPARKLARSA